MHRSSPLLTMVFAVAAAGCGALVSVPQPRGARPVYPEIAPPPPREASAVTTEGDDDAPASGDGGHVDVEPLFSMLASIESKREVSATKRVVSRCLGAMIAPRVVLTAGHCVDKESVITVGPASDARVRRVGVSSFWFDSGADHSSRMVDMNASDVAILVLDKPLAMPAYARYARRPLHLGALAFGFRHAPNAEDVIQTMSFRLAPHPTHARYYASVGFGAPGDSGSPVFVQLGDEMVLIAVLAGGSPGREVFARADVMSSKLDEIVASTTTRWTAAAPPGAKVIGSRRVTVKGKPAPPRPPAKPGTTQAAPPLPSPSPAPRYRWE